MTTPQAPKQYWPPAYPMQNGAGTAGLVCGILGFFIWPVAIAGLICSGIGLSNANQGKANNHSSALAGLIISIIAVVLGLVLIIVWANAAADTNTYDPSYSDPSYYGPTYSDPSYGYEDSCDFSDSYC